MIRFEDDNPCRCFHCGKWLEVRKQFAHREYEDVILCKKCFELSGLGEGATDTELTNHK